MKERRRSIRSEKEKKIRNLKPRRDLKERRRVWFRLT